jgi:hypothetical protein
MGFWSWFFGSSESRSEKAAAEELRKKQHERRMADYHTAMVREALLDTSTPMGFSITISEHYESVVLEALMRYTLVPYAVYKTADEDMTFRGECKIHVAYIQFPFGSIMGSEPQQARKSSDISNGHL